MPRIMKKRTLALATALGLFCSVGAYAADMPGAIFPFPPVASDQNLTAELQKLGFTNVQEIRGEGDSYDTIAMWEGEFVAINIDGRNGAITKRYHPDVQKLNLAANANESAMIAALQQRGYTVTAPVGRRGDLYVVPVTRLNAPGYVLVNPAAGTYIDTAASGRQAIQVTGDWSNAYVYSQLGRLGYTNIALSGRTGDVIVGQAYRNGRAVQLSIDTHTGVVYES